MIVIDMDKPKNCAHCWHHYACPKYFHDKAMNDPFYKPKDCPIKCDIEDIKAEIMKYAEDEYIKENEAQGMMFCCDIIDKHMKGDTDGRTEN